MTHLANIYWTNKRHIILLYHTHLFRNLWSAEISLECYEAGRKGDKFLEKFSCEGYVSLKTKKLNLRKKCIIWSWHNTFCLKRFQALTFNPDNTGPLKINCISLWRLEKWKPFYCVFSSTGWSFRSRPLVFYLLNFPGHPVESENRKWENYSQRRVFFLSHSSFLLSQYPFSNLAAHLKKKAIHTSR